jgi:DNA-binding IclR family transcriptional regulator
LDAVAPVVGARNRAGHPEIEAVLRTAAAPKAAALREIVAALLVDPVAADHNPEDRAEIEADQLQAAQPEAVATPALGDQAKTVV